MVGSELEQAQRENAELRDKYLRAAAEVENTRKLTEREVAARATQEQRNLLRQLLEVADNLERVLDVPADEKTTREGIRLTLRRLQNILERAGVERMDVERGQVFDPTQHEAVDMRSGGNDTDGEITVQEAVQAGYRHKDQLLRPARVIVSR
jgi:molecular chaperone GrpE